MRPSPSAVNATEKGGGGRVLALSLALAFSAARCSCDEPEPPRDAGQIGEGDPIEADAGELYVEDAGPVVCDEDEHEENDARADAVAATSGAALEGRFCGEDDDWYAIDATPGCAVLVELRFDPEAAGDLDLLVFDPDGQLAGSSNTLGDEEIINTVADKTGPYAARVRGGDRDDIGYTITLTTSCAADLVCPADDRFEDNDGPTAPHALDEGVAADGVLCGVDEDWFTPPVGVGCIADLRLSFEHDNGDVDLALFRADGTTRVALSQSTGDSERVTKTIVESGMLARVFFFSAEEQNPYRLIVDETCAGQIACPTDDPFEPNDTRPQARDLNAALDAVVGTICANDDFYATTPTTGCTLHAELSFVDAEGDLDLQLLDTADAVVASSAGTSDAEVIDFTATSTARLALRVFGFSAAENDYRLTLSSTCP